MSDQQQFHDLFFIAVVHLSKAFFKDRMPKANFQRSKNSVTVLFLKNQEQTQNN